MLPLTWPAATASSASNSCKAAVISVSPFVSASNAAWLCRQTHLPVLCSTNPSVEMEKLYGDKLSGFYGYSHLTGGYAGGQAEYARVFNGKS